MGKEERLRKIDASTVKVIQSVAAFSPPAGSPTSGNADTVDGYHAAAVPVANYLLALNSSAQVNVDAIPTHDILSKHSATGSAYQVVGLSASNTLGLLTPASTVGANQIPIGGTGGAITWSGAQTFSALGTFNAGVTIAAGQTLTTPAITATANLTINPVGDVVLDPTGNDILPNTGYDLNLGSLAKKYLTLHAAELWVETLVAQSTIATIGGRILVGPTTTLTRDLTAGATTIYVKHNEMASGDRVYMEANGALEFMAITGSASLQAEGDYAYTVTRNLDGSGANAWSAGDAVFNTGAAGDGFIDIYSVAGVKAGTEYGPAIAGNVRDSATYNDWTTHWAIGNLNGLYGYGATTYGFAAGKYSTTTSWVAADATNGVRIMRGSTGLGQWQVDGDFFLGTDISAAATTNLAVFNAAQTYNGESVDVGDLLLGDNSSNKANIFWDKSAGRLNFRGGTTVQAYIDTTGALAAGGGNIVLNSSMLRLGQYTGDQSDPTRLHFGPATYDVSERHADVYLVAPAGAAGYLMLGGSQRDAVDGSVPYGFVRLKLYLHGAATTATLLDLSGANIGNVGVTFLQADFSGNLSNRGYLYPGTGSGLQTTAYLYADASNHLYATNGQDWTTPMLIVKDGSGSARELAITSVGIWRRDSDTDDGNVTINAKGYNDGATRFRDFSVGNGKGTDILLIDGSASLGIFTGNLRADAVLYVGGTAYDANSYLTRDATGPIYNVDANDYIQYDRTNNRWLFYIGSAVKGYVDSTGFHDGAPP